MDLHSFQVIAIALKNPLVLVGFCLFLIVGVCQRIVGQVLQSRNPRLGHLLLQKIVHYGFFIALLMILLGFSLQWQRDWQASTPDNHPKNRIEGGIHGENNTAAQSIRLEGKNVESAGLNQPVKKKDGSVPENNFSGGIHGHGNTVKQSISAHEEPE